MVLLKYKAQNAPDQPIMSEAYYYRLVLSENNQKDAYDLIFRGELLKSNHDILHPMLKYQVRWLDGFRYFEENIYEPDKKVMSFLNNSIPLELDYMLEDFPEMAKEYDDVLWGIRGILIDLYNGQRLVAEKYPHSAFILDKIETVLKTVNHKLSQIHGKKI